MVVPLAAFGAGAVVAVLVVVFDTVHDPTLVGTTTLGFRVALVVKVLAVRSLRAPGWFLPAAGELLFALLVSAVLTSALWYVAAKGWPVRSGPG